jgi:hypothetical protein
MLNAKEKNIVFKFNSFQFENLNSILDSSELHYPNSFNINIIQNGT